MHTRKQIIDFLDKTPQGNTEFEKVIDSFNNKDSRKWFKGIIESLYYKPNEFVLINKSHPDESPFALLYPSMYTASRHCIYDNLICEIDFIKADLWLPKEQGFTMSDDEFPDCDKRLASYCVTTNNWSHPQRNNFINVNFDYFKFCDVNTEEFWIESFNFFKL